MKSRLRLKIYPPLAGLEPGTGHLDNNSNFIRIEKISSNEFTRPKESHGVETIYTLVRLLLAIWCGLTLFAQIYLSPGLRMFNDIRTCILSYLQLDLWCWFDDGSRSITHKTDDPVSSKMSLSPWLIQAWGD